MKIVAVIPARWKSSRFEGKPLADLEGKSVLQRVHERTTEAIVSAEVFIATDDSRIESECKRIGANCIRTSETCRTGTDRVAEVAGQVHADWYVNIQGDEPFIAPDAIRRAIAAIADDSGADAINCYSKIVSAEEFRSVTVPKVVVGEVGQILYLSRAGIPVNKEGAFIQAFRQLGLYCYSKKALLEFGPDKSKSFLEAIEDIEILRLLERGYRVRGVLAESPGPAIDTPGDLRRAIELIRSGIFPR